MDGEGVDMASSVYNYTFTGFGTRIRFKRHDEQQYVETICTGAIVNFGQKIMNSNGSFGGGVAFGQSGENSTDSTIQTNGASRMATPQVSVSLNFQMTTKVLTTFMDILKNRKDKCTVQITGAGGTIELNNCYWNKMSLQVQQNSLMTGSIDFNVVQDYDTIYAFKMFAMNSQKTNENNFGLFGENFDCNLIPYYSTAVKLNGQDIQFDGLDDPTSQVGTPPSDADGQKTFIPIGWSLDISQNVSLRTFCLHTVDDASFFGETQSCSLKAPLAKRVAFGLVSCNINITTLVDAKNGLQLEKLAPYIDIQEYQLSSDDYISICCLDKSFREQEFLKLNYLQLQSATPNYADASNYMSCQLNYQVNKISIEISE